MNAKRIRAAVLWLHRWIGLMLVTFLVIEGVTGTMLAFRGPLSHFFDPALSANPPSPTAKRLDLATLIEISENTEPKANFRWFQPIHDHVAILVMEPPLDSATGKPRSLDFECKALDPWTGKEIRRLRHGLYTDGFLPNVMPFVYDLHRRLAISNAGLWVLSIVALLWTFEIFYGLYITFPAAIGNFLRRWASAWVVRWRAGSKRVTFDTHRAFGLWLLPVSIIFAWSSVELTDNTGAFGFVMERLLGATEIAASHPQRSPKTGPLTPDWHKALARGQVLVAELGKKEGFVAGEPEALWCDRDERTYSYRAHTDRVFPKDQLVYVTFDGDTGALLEVGMPKGNLMFNLGSLIVDMHMITGSFDYCGYRIFVAAYGLALAGSAVTGVLIWRMKKSRLKQKTRPV